MSSEPFPRVHCCLLGDDKVPIPLQDIVRLDQSSVSKVELPKNSKRHLSWWSDLPLEVRYMIYNYAYADLAEASHRSCDERFTVRIDSGRYHQPHNSDSLKSIAVKDDDIVLSFHHSLARRLVSKQWFVETAIAASKLKEWYLYFHGHNLMSFLPVLTESATVPITNSTTATEDSALDDLTRFICTVTLQHLSRATIRLHQDQKFSDFCPVLPLPLCDKMRWIRMRHDNWRNDQYWVKNPKYLGSLEIITLTDTDSLKQEGKVIHKISENIAESLRSKYKVAKYLEIGDLPPDMYAAIRRWCDELEVFQDFKTVVNDWQGPESKSLCDFRFDCSCAVEREGHSTLRMNICYEVCGDIYLDVSSTDA